MVVLDPAAAEEITASKDQSCVLAATGTSLGLAFGAAGSKGWQRDSVDIHCTQPH